MAHLTEHTVTVSAPARTVYDLIAGVENWPRIFPPTVHVDHVERGEAEERIRIWATANGQPKCWTSRRHLDPRRLEIRFRQEVSQPPVAAMGGAWLLEAVSDHATTVRLTHDFEAVGDDPDNVGWILRAIEHNSHAELEALKAAAEQSGPASDLLLTFDDSVRVDGLAGDVYDFLRDAQLWSERLPHVARVVLREDTPDVQVLEMDTRSPDGGTHTTESVRVCLPPDRIVYKQLRMPALMKVHTGQWTVATADGATVVTSTHTVVIEPEAVPGSVAEARTLIREALTRNSRTTMHHAKEHAEANP